jgi:hypothetical protein
MRFLPALLKFSHKFGGPWKFLLMNLRGGQIQGTILSFSTFAWIISNLSSHNSHVSSADLAVLVISIYLATYIGASMVATHLYFGRPWLAYVNLLGDVVGIAGSIVVAGLLHPSAANCNIRFMILEGEAISMGFTTKACSLQKVVFAANITNR